jgi:hypothetical protein
MFGAKHSNACDVPPGTATVARGASFFVAALTQASRSPGSKARTRTVIFGAVVHLSQDQSANAFVNPTDPNAE